MPRYIKKAAPVIDRFNDKYFEMVWSGCWIWTGSINPKGYGRINIGSRTNSTRMTVAAHRLSWQLHYGIIPEGMLVCHRCDVPCCVNPTHLFLGTIADNNRDKMDKGRFRVVRNFGEKNGSAKFSDEVVAKIRRLAGTMSQTALGAMFGVSQTHISQLLNETRRPTREVVPA